MTKVIYIAGCSRSGSTVFDAILGSAESAVSAGELTYLPQAGWVRSEFCSCGERADECPLWSDVRRRWEEQSGISAEELVEIQARMERFRFMHRSLFGFGAGHQRRYSDQQQLLFASIADSANASVVVDASKNPLRAKALSRVPGIDLRIVHLVRDGRGVAWSMMKQFQKNVEAGLTHDIKPQDPVKSITSWARTTRLTEFAIKAIDANKKTVLRYEDFVESPAEALKSVSEIADEDFSAVGSRLERQDPIEFGHTIAGNRVRMKKSIVLRPDMEWREAMDPALKERLWRRVRRQMQHYGYAA